MVLTLNKNTNVIGPEEVKKFFGDDLQPESMINVSDCDLAMLEKEGMYLIFRPKNFWGEKITIHNINSIYKQVAKNINQPLINQINEMMKKMINLKTDNDLIKDIMVGEIESQKKYFENQLLSENFYEFGTFDVSGLPHEEVASGWHLISTGAIYNTSNLVYDEQTLVLQNELAKLCSRFECLEHLKSKFKSDNLIAADYRHSFTDLIVDLLVIYTVKNKKYLKDVFSWTKTLVPEERPSAFRTFMLVGGGSDYNNSIVCFGNDLTFDLEPDLMSTLSIKIE